MYTVEIEGQYINVYSDDELYHQLKLPKNVDFKKFYEKINAYYTSKNENYKTTPYTEKNGDSVSHPSHYNIGNIEVISAIDDWQLSFALGNAVKYIARAGHKNPQKTIEDLEKAKWYIEHEIKRLNKQSPNAQYHKEIACDLISEMRTLLNEE